MEEKKLQCLLFLIQKYSPYTVVGYVSKILQLTNGVQKKISCFYYIISVMHYSAVIHKNNISASCFNF